MRSTLAETLLTKIMDWSPEEIDRERPLLQAMANLKWNEYQQYAPGTRFLESLVKWLQQFADLSDKHVAYRLIREHLIFISSEQMAYLVNNLFSEKINPILIRKTAQEQGIAHHHVSKVLKDTAYRQNLRTSLFVGLSDGSRIDQFRRGAFLNNEQVIPTYDPSDKKVEDLLTKLRDDVPEGVFKTMFLIDDFTASGTTYCRPDGGGKLGKIFSSLFMEEGRGFHSIIDHKGIEVHLLFYIATIEALQNIRNGIQAWKEKNERDFTCTVDCLLPIDASVKKRITDDSEIMAFIAKYFDPDVVDSHYELGKHDLPYLGFNECGLPLVLNHNSPNNSLAILWSPADKRVKGLFPRISRHREK